MNNEIDYTDLYGVRTLVFIETEPQSNKYCQVLLSPEMFRNMTDTISKKLTEGEMEEREIKTSEEEYTLPDLPEAYSNYSEL